MNLDLCWSNIATGEQKLPGADGRESVRGQFDLHASRRSNCPDRAACATMVS